MNRAIVRNTNDGQLWMMNKDDFRYNNPKYAYEHIADVTKVGKYQPVPDYYYKAREVQTSRGIFQVFADGSAQEIA